VTVSEAVKQWPFVESPGEFAARVTKAANWFGFGNMVGVVRHVLIENSPTIDPAYMLAAIKLDDLMDDARDAYQDVFDGQNHEAALHAALSAALHPQGERK
jgi:hypothetical protein